MGGGRGAESFANLRIDESGRITGSGGSDAAGVEGNYEIYGTRSNGYDIEFRYSPDEIDTLLYKGSMSHDEMTISGTWEWETNHKNIA